MKNLTISKRLGLLVGAAIAVVVLLTAVSLRSGNALADDARLLAAVPDVMRRATLADMYHDATYGSVYRAVTAVDDAALPDIRTEVTDALAGLRSSLLSVSDSGLDPAVEVAVDAVLPAVDAYERTALDVLDRRDAAQPTDTAEAEFVAAFEELEQALPTVADAVQVRIDALSSHAEDTAAALRQEAMIGAGVGIVLFGIIALLISRSIVRPVRRTAEVLDEVAAGDLRSRLDTSGRDELASMARSLNTALDELGSAFGEIVESAQVLASSSEELTATSTQLASAAEETSVQAGYVSSAAGHVAQSVSGLASGTSEMTDSIQDISYNAQDAVVVAGRAMSVADETNSTVIKLGSSSAEIGSVVQTITSIAEQTNLLALNATIEAARAGEAGKGFAVVAQEVKELSRATANATADIAERITAIQSDAEASVAAIARITEIIARVGETQSSIASAVEQQTATTDQLSRNIGEVSAGSNEIAENIDGMARTATDLSAGAHQTRSTAVELSAMALQLHQLASRYRR